MVSTRSVAAVALFLAGCCTVAFAQDGPQRPLRRTRVFYVGNDLLNELDFEAFETVARGDGDLVVWGRHVLPRGSLAWLWDHEAGLTKSPYGASRKALEKHAWDFVVLQPAAVFEREFAHAAKFARLAYTKNPQTQICIFGTWPRAQMPLNWCYQFNMPRGVRSTPVKSARRFFPQHLYEGVLAHLPEDASADYASRSFRAQSEVMVIGLRQRFPDARPARLVPVAHTMHLLGQKMAAGQVPGFTDLWELYSDPAHLNKVGSYIAACTFYAVLFDRSPVGLPLGDYAKHRPGEGPRLLTAPLARIIQETVWEVVATVGLSGVTSDRPVTVASPSMVPAVAGCPYWCELIPAFGKGPYSWSIASGSLPAGIKLRPNGWVTGRSQTPGRYGVVAMVSDVAGDTAQREFTLSVEEDVAPKIETFAVPALSVGGFESVSLAASGGNGRLRWRVDNGELPPGMTVRPDGTLSGAPGREGKYEVTLATTDTDLWEPDTDTRTLILRVGPPREDLLKVRQVKKGTISVDGKIDEPCWRLDQKLAKPDEGADHYDNDTSFDVVWDENSLYVAVKVLDTDMTFDRWSPLDGDCVTVYLDGRCNRGKAYDFDDRRILATVGSRPAEKRGPFRTSTFAVALDGGYSLEVAIPFRSLGVRSPFDGLVLGFDLECRDRDRADVGRAFWHGSAQNDRSPAEFGAAIMVADDD